MSSSTGSRVVPATASTTTRSSPASLLSRRGLADVGPAEERDAARAAHRPRRSSAPAPRAAPPARRRAGRRCRGRAARRPGRARRGRATTARRRRPRSRASSTLLATSTTGLPARRSTRTTASSVSVGADRGVDHEERRRRRPRWRTRPARRPAPARPWASCSQPPVSTTVKRRPFHVGVVGDPVAGHAGHVLDDGLAAAEDPVDQRRLADVGPADDGEHRDRAGARPRRRRRRRTRSRRSPSATAHRRHDEVEDGRPRSPRRTGATSRPRSRRRPASSEVGDRGVLRRPGGPRGRGSRRSRRRRRCRAPPARAGPAGPARRR